MASTQREPLLKRLGSVFRQYGPLGFTAFGGPGVHVIILRERFVHELKWVDERTFIDLFALGNALPGPGSTQLAFSIAVVKHGVLPGIVAFLCWSLPGALGMAGLAAGISNIPSDLPPIVLALLSGLNAAAVGLIALAAYQLGTAASTDKITLLLVWLSASFGICYHAPWMYPTLIAVGGLVTLLWDFRRQWIYVPLRKLVGEKGEKRHENEMELSAIPHQPLSSAATPIHSQSLPSPIEVSAFPSPPASPVSPPTALEIEPSKVDLATTFPPSTVHRRTPVEQNIDIEILTNPSPVDRLQVVSARSAWCLIGGFVLLLVIPLATRGGLANAGKNVPRELDVSEP